MTARPVARARRRASAKLLQRRLRRGLGVRGTVIPHRFRGVEDVPSAALAAMFAAAEPRYREVLVAVEAFADAFARFGGAAPAPRFEQDWFPALDAAALYTVLRSHRPCRYIEIGSGHSTRVAVRAVADGALATRLTAIDPAPRATIACLPVEWCRQLVQAIDPDLVSALQHDDVLFVDSSHVLTAGSDVDFILTVLLPRLRPGVILHVHDVLLPDPYPTAWAWRGYNEQQAIAGLLLGGFEILFASHYVRTRAPHLLGPVARALPRLPGARETSLWLRRL